MADKKSVCSSQSIRVFRRMSDRRSTLAAALLGSLAFLAIGPLHAQQQRPLTSLPDLHAISNATATQSIPVAFQGTVTYYEKGNVDLFVQDRGAAIYVETVPDLQVIPGDRVLVEGITRASFRPEIQAQRVLFLRHGSVPPPIDATFPQLIRAELDCRRARIRAVVHAADIVADGAQNSVLLELMMPGGPIQAQIANGGTAADLPPLLDSTIDITGAVAGRFDSKMQMTGILLEVPSFADLHIVKPAPHAPQQIPPRSFDEILQSFQVDDQTARVRVQGTITYYQAGAAMVLQDGPHALWVDTRSEEPHRIGERVFVSGFPDVRDGAVVLTRAEIESTGSAVPLRVTDLGSTELATGIHAFDLVSVEGQLIMRVREAAQDQYVIASQGRVFSAIYRHPERGMNLTPLPMRELPMGSRVRVTGICVLDRGDQFRGPAAFHLLLRSSDDIALLAGPSLISVRNLGIVLAILLIALFVLIAKALLLERKLRRRDVTTAAAVERWRNRVIDGINQAIPLRDTLLQITELLSFKLQVDFSWAEIELEGTFGNCPDASQRSGLQIVELAIPARSGALLGKICIGFLPGATQRRIEPEALENAARLAALAIETGGKYSELVRRSELDPLTNARNRFAFDRALDLAIETGKPSGAAFGLIYIDLDGFKQVNDQFGHRVGDSFLQETVTRLAAQLRSGDLLARIGGDEFAVLLTKLDRGDEIQEIADRLQTCFDTPFRLGPVVVPASASIGSAVFPDDAATHTALLECADARMYEAKRRKRRDLQKIHVVPGSTSAKIG